MTKTETEAMTKLKWVKTSDHSGARVWVDVSAFYCIRERLSERKPPFKLLPAPAFDAWETYPGNPTELIGNPCSSLADAKRRCQGHLAKVQSYFGEEAA